LRWNNTLRTTLGSWVLGKSTSGLRHMITPYELLVHFVNTLRTTYPKSYGKRKSTESATTIDISGAHLGDVLAGRGDPLELLCSKTSRGIPGGKVWRICTWPQSDAVQDSISLLPHNDTSQVNELNQYSCYTEISRRVLTALKRVPSKSSQTAVVKGLDSCSSRAPELLTSLA